MPPSWNKSWTNLLRKSLRSQHPPLRSNRMSHTVMANQLRLTVVMPVAVAATVKCRIRTRTKVRTKTRINNSTILDLPVKMLGGVMRDKEE